MAAVFVLFNFFRDVMSIVQICLFAHSRKQNPQRSRADQMMNWFKSAESTADNDSCSQCQKSFKETSEVVTLTCCEDQMMCADCIIERRLVNKLNCPNCRQPLF